MNESIVKIVSGILTAAIGKETRRKILARAANLLAGNTKRGQYAAEYPPETWRNKPPGNNGSWYERGFGTRYITRKSAIGGSPFFKNIGGAGNNTSQDFQDNWRVSVEDIEAHVFTEVTYAPFLLDTTIRPAWVKEVGWRDVNQIAEEFTPVFEKVILEELDAAVDKALRK